MDQLDVTQDLMILMTIIPWAFIEASLAKFFSNVGRATKSIRLMAGLLILKYIENLSDEVLRCG
jgi:hypothetical protein